MDTTKQQTLETLVRLLGQAGVPYALIGGVAVQLHREEPRTTIDIDIAVLDRSQIPRAALELGGFTRAGSFEHSENWRGPDGTPVQFTADPWLRDAVRQAETRPVGSAALRVIGRMHLLRAKLRAAADPARRKSKRLIDLSDAQGLVEETPALAEDLTPDERSLLASVLPDPGAR
jgi:hypothetical protein